MGAYKEEFQLTTADGQVQTYYVCFQLPTDSTTRTLPLFLHLHGVNGRAFDFLGGGN